MLILLQLSVSAQVPASSKPVNARVVEQSRNIDLPANDDHYLPVKTYVEQVPDPDYFHASEAAYEDFNDMKFGIRIHWGIYSMWQLNHESWAFLELSNEKKQEYQNLYKSFNPVGFDAEEWMAFFERSGIKCFAFTSKHHEGFSMFDTKARVKSRANYTAPGGPAIEDCDLAYSIMETPFKRDIVKELCDAAHKHKMRIDLYFSHPDWYDADCRPYNFAPLQTEDSKINPYTHYGDTTNYTASFSKIIVAEPTDAEVKRMMARHRQQLTELLTNYGKIDMICLDQYLGPRVWPEMKATIKALRKIQPDVMFRCRGIGNYGDYYTPENFVPGNKENTKMPWMTIDQLASTFSYDSVAANYKGSKYIIHNLIDAVSKGGSYMIGTGPDGNGRFHPTAIKQFEETGAWLKINGEGIYGSRAAAAWKEGDHLRYTTTKDKKYLYAFAMAWPGATLQLKQVVPAKGKNIYLLGYPRPLTWTYKQGVLTIQLPTDLTADSALRQQAAWGFRMEGTQKSANEQ
nr:alpha-L-fucosidase [Flavihumibacter fluvii]